METVKEISKEYYFGYEHFNGKVLIYMRPSDSDKIELYTLENIVLKFDESILDDSKSISCVDLNLKVLSIAVFDYIQKCAKSTSQYPDIIEYGDNCNVMASLVYLGKDGRYYAEIVKLDELTQTTERTRNNETDEEHTDFKYISNILGVYSGLVDRYLFTYAEFSPVNKHGMFFKSVDELRMNNEKICCKLV